MLLHHELIVTSSWVNHPLVILVHQFIEVIFKLQNDSMYNIVNSMKLN